MDEEEVIDSIAKGHFLFSEPSELRLGGSKKKGSSKKTAVAPIGPGRVEDEDVKYTRAREMARSRYWSHVQEETNLIVGDINRETFVRIHKFIEESTCVLHKLWNSADVEKLSSATDIPAALLFAGVNVPDHATIFNLLRTHLRREGVRHIASLRSRDCTTFNVTLRNLLRQYMGEERMVGVVDEDDEEEYRATSGTGARGTTSGSDLKHMDFNMLLRWYRDNQSATRGKLDPLVLVIEDVESFKTSIFQRLVAVLCERHPHPPFILVFGVATSMDSLNLILPRSISTRLQTERFNVQPAISSLDGILDRIIMDPRFQLQVGPRAYTFMVEAFLLHNFTVTKFIQALQFAVSEFFSKEPLSFLLVVDDVELESAVQGLGYGHAEYIRSMASVRQYIEHEAPAQARKSLLSYDDVLLSQARQWIEDIREFIRVRPHVFRIFCATVESLLHRQAPSKRELYLQWLDGSLLKSDIVETMFTRIKKLEVLDARNLLDIWERMLAAEKDDFEDGLSMVKKLKSDLEKSVSETSKQKERVVAEAATAKVSAHKRRRLLLGTGSTTAETPVKLMLNSIVVFFETFFEGHLAPFTSMPMHEVFWYNKAHELKKAFSAAPRATMQTALVRPGDYLKSKTAVTHDTSTLFIIMQDWGRLLNAHDWFEQFVEKTNAPKVRMEQMQARFLRGCADLEHLGIIKRSTRKTDHYTKLI